MGSDFGEVSHGEMLRSDDKVNDNKQQVQLSLPHNIPKQVRVTIKQKNMNHLNQSLNNSSPENILGIENQDTEQKEADDYGKFMIFDCLFYLIINCINLIFVIIYTSSS